MSEARGLREERVGMVVSNKMDKTIVVAIKTRVKHGNYKTKLVVKISPIFVLNTLGTIILFTFLLGVLTFQP